MDIELTDALIGAVGLLVAVWGVIFQQRKAQEKEMSDVVNNIKAQIDELKQDKVNTEDMKEYVKLWTAPITRSLDHLTEETKRTREMMEQIYHEGRPR